MSDLREAVARAGARIEAAGGDPLLAFAGFDLDFLDVSEAIDQGTSAAILRMSAEGGAGPIQDLAANMLLIGLYVRQLREEREAAERLAEVGPKP